MWVHDMMPFGIDFVIISQTACLDVNPVEMMYGECLTLATSYDWMEIIGFEIEYNINNLGIACWM